MTDSWDDIVGDQKKPAPSEKARIYSKLSPPKVYAFEDNATTDLRTRSNLEAISSLGVEVEKTGHGSECSATLDGRKIDFWPATDSYYLQSQGKFGTGIRELCEKIRKYRAKT